MNVYIIKIWKGGETVEIEIKLHELMAKKKIRQIRVLSKLSGVSEQSISKLLNEKSKYMRLDSLAKICSALDCEIGELIEFKKKG
jgi:putative transcriptional regulator